MRTALVWFRRDLRLADNPALRAALDAHDRVLPVFVHAPDEEAPWQPGAASRWWLDRSLRALDDDLRARRSSLHVRQGASLRTLRTLVRASGADAVYWNRLYEPVIAARDARVESALRSDGVDVRTFNAALFVEPWDIETGSGEPYRVFTPFWRKARAALELHPPAFAPRAIASPHVAGSLRIDALKLRPTIAWDTGLADAWQPGEAGAQKALRRFSRRALADYRTRRDRPAEAGTSRLSPHLHFGEISPMQIAWSLRHRHGAAHDTDAEAYLRELGWREFSHHLLHHFPQTATKDFNPRFATFGWARKSPAKIAAWQRGRTGIPIVDAGLRELWTTGWMHNRVRMLTASFLTKNLRQYWLVGARWFWDTLVDADLPNNTQGWQWTAGTGADAAPYFRIFNPVTQGERFDPRGDYVRRWVPELAPFRGKSIHAPWKEPAKLARCDYPMPLVDLGETREAALDAFKALRTRSQPHVGGKGATTKR